MGSNGFYPLVNVYKKRWKDDCFATFYEHALQHVFEEFALFGGTLSHIMLANSHCAKKNKLPLRNEQTTSSHEQAFYVKLPEGMLAGFPIKLLHLKQPGWWF